MFRALDEEYQELDTDIELDGDVVVITAETPGFSTSVTSGNVEPEEETPEPDDQAGFGAVIALLALLGAALLTARRNALN